MLALGAVKGGMLGQQTIEEVHELDATTSSSLLGATLSQANDVLYLVGGHDPNASGVADPWLKVRCASLVQGDGRVWSPDSENEGVVNRRGHAAFSIQDALYVFGGEDSQSNTLESTDAAELTTRGLKWTSLDGVGPSKRAWAGHCVAAGTNSRDVGLVHGGRNGNALMDDVWVLDPHQSPAWAKLATKGPKPSQRAFHTLTAVGDKARHAVLTGGLIMAENGDLVHAPEELWVLDCSAAFFYEEPSLDQVPVRDPARWACVEQNGVNRFLHAAVGYVKGDVFTLVVLGGASFHEEDDDALVLQVPCELEEDHVASLDLTAGEWRKEASQPKMGSTYQPCGHASIYVDLEDAPGILCMGGVSRESIVGTEVVDSTSVPTCWLQTSEYLCRFAECRLAHSYEEPPEEFESIAEGWGRQETEDGDLYEGQFVAGLRCGTGRCQYASTNGGGTYNGDWKDNKRHGEGTWEGPGRDTFGECYYEGAWEKDLRHGKGISRYEDGSRFEGEYRDDWRYYGTYWLANGDVYVGYFGEHGRHGEGVCDYADSGKYEGLWKDDLRHGLGDMYYADGGVYKGSWRTGNRNGDGDMRFANRDHYIGKYVHDVRCGRGSQKYASGASYEGEWLDDMRHGQGTHTDENGVYHGGWAQDKEEGYGDWEGTNRPDDEAAYAGAWHLGLRCGMASSKYHDGATFEGEFRDDSRYHGRLDEPAGDVYEGYFQKHLRHGSGHQIYADGGDYQGAWQIGQRWGTGDYENPFERYSGEWERNERHGQGTWAGTRGDTEYAAKEVHYEGMWAEGLRCGACAARDQDGSAFEGEYWNDHRAKGVLKLANGDVYEGHFAANGRHGLGECTYADGSQFVGEWRDDKPDTDAGKWVGVSEIEDLAETYKGQATKKGYFSRSPGRKYQLGAARVVPDMY